MLFKKNTCWQEATSFRYNEDFLLAILIIIFTWLCDLILFVMINYGPNFIYIVC